MTPTFKALLHILTTYLSTLVGMIGATSEPVTTGLIVSLAPAAAVAVLHGIENTAAAPRKS